MLPLHLFVNNTNSPVLPSLGAYSGPPVHPFTYKATPITALFPKHVPFLTQDSNMQGHSYKAFLQGIYSKDKEINKEDDYMKQPQCVLQQMGSPKILL